MPVRILVPTLTGEMRASWYCPPLDKMARPEDIGEAATNLIQDDTLAGRTILYDRPGEWMLVRDDLNLWALSEEI